MKAGRGFSFPPQWKKAFQKNRKSSGITPESNYPTLPSRSSDIDYEENMTTRCGFWCRNICHCVAAVAIARTAVGTRQMLLRKTGTGRQMETTRSAALQNW